LIRSGCDKQVGKPESLFPEQPAIVIDVSGKPYERKSFDENPFKIEQTTERSHKKRSKASRIPVKNNEHSRQENA
jgi:hypothetical protein